MKDLLLTLLHLAVMTARLCGPGGVRAVIAEHFLLKQPLIVVHPYAVVRRTRRRGGAVRGLAGCARLVRDGWPPSRRQRVPVKPLPAAN